MSNQKFSRRPVSSCVCFKLLSLLYLSAFAELVGKNMVSLRNALKMPPAIYQPGATDYNPRLYAEVSFALMSLTYCQNELDERCFHISPSVFNTCMMTVQELKKGKTAVNKLNANVPNIIAEKCTQFTGSQKWRILLFVRVVTNILFLW